MLSAFEHWPCRRISKTVDLAVFVASERSPENRPARSGRSRAERNRFERVTATTNPAIAAKSWLAQTGFALVPVGRLLVSVSQTQDCGFIARPTGNLHSNWKAAARKSAGNRDGWQTSQV